MKPNSIQNKKNTNIENNNLENIKKSLSASEKKQLIKSIYKTPKNKTPLNIKKK